MAEGRFNVDHTAFGTQSDHLNTLKKEIVYLHSAVYLIDRYYVRRLLWCYSWAILQTLNGKYLASHVKLLIGAETT